MYISPNCIHIDKGYTFKGREMAEALFLWSMMPEARGCDVFFHRSRLSLILEWSAHNALYHLGICRRRTADVDLESPQPVLTGIAWCILGAITYPFIY